MSVFETVLIFVGAPAVAVAAITALVYAGGIRRGRRYRPGRPFQFTPVWFLSSRGQASADRVAGEDRRAVTGAPDRAALPGPERAELAAAEEGAEPALAAAPHGPTGGASDRW